MKLFSNIIRLVRSGSSSSQYYKSMNEALHMVKDRYTMLHYPLFVHQTDDFIRAQENLTHYCLSYVEPIKGKSVLEVGCGNGVQAKFIALNYRPKFITGIDLNRFNIRIANLEKKRRRIGDAFFLVDDAQQMRKIQDETFDIVINIESAFHYPDKEKFLNEIYRVLVPGGKYIIADILRKRPAHARRRIVWKKKMILHHWTLGQYMEGLKKARLDPDRTDDITLGVIKGFRNFPSWFRQMNKKQFVDQLVFKIFYLVNIFLNIYLLKRTRQYYIFSGTKNI